MFTFIHTYTPESWPGTKKLFRKGDGLKIMHKPDYPKGASFNEIAVEGSPLYETLKELRCPFYIDRLHGGIGTLRALYPYDEELLKKYEELLGDNFWGFQLHEWASNYRSDILRYLEAREQHADMDEETFWNWVKEDPDHLLLEQYTADEWKELDCPYTYDEYVKGAARLFRLRLEQMKGRLFAADSYFMTAKPAIEQGAKMYLPEIGWQIGDMRIQMAYARGMAKAAGIRWGVYYECWCRTLDMPGSSGFAIPLSLKEGQDEWLEDMVHTSLQAQNPGVHWEWGGSSRSLQERSWLYAYLAGATILGEEYGVCNTFYDYNDFELSEYGKVKKKFLDWVDAHPEIGTTWTPIALVLPKDLGIYEFSDSDTYTKFPYHECGDVNDKCRALPEDITEAVKRIRKATSMIFGHTGQYGNEAHVLKNGGYPDVFDIIHADTVAEYPYYINLTEDPDWKPVYGGQVIEVEDVDNILERQLPYKMHGDVHTMINRLEDGWLLMVMNQDGIQRQYFEKEKRMAEAVKTIRIEIQENREIQIADQSEGCGVNEEQLRNQEEIKLGAGEWFLLHIKEKH